MAEERMCNDAATRRMLLGAVQPNLFTDTNGIVNHNDCDIPNNNLCGGASDCYIAKDCANNSDNNDDDVRDESQDSIESTTTTTSQDEESSSIHESTILLEPSTSPKENKHNKSAPMIDNKSKSDKALFGKNYNNGAIGAIGAMGSIGANDKNSKVRKKTTTAGRGRPRKALVAMYHSQISGDKNTIKIRIKKSNLSTQLTPNKKKTGRRKKHKASDTDASDHETTSKRSKGGGGGGHELSQDVEPFEPHVQSPWGGEIPHKILHAIFQYVVARDGALPAVVKLLKVCKLWRDVGSEPSLWRKVDLNCVKERARTDLRLHWLIQNRLGHCQDLNLGEWKVRDIQTSLEAITMSCPDLRGLNLSGWKGLNADNLKYITTECSNLERLDLSSINSTSAINAQPLVSLGQTMNSRLTHLVLAHNKIAGFTQIMASIAGNCPNLELLDISNIRTFAHNTALLHVEKFQIGCPKLRVLRLTNSQIWLAPASLSDQVASPGFPALEELSLAGIEDDKTTTARCVDDDGIERILKNSTKLRLLDVRGCIRLTDSGLVKVPAWDLEHLFLSACLITRTQTSGLELILQKWSHSLQEVDLAWSTATNSLDAAVLALAEKAEESPLRTINLCGSSVSLEPVKAILTKCPNIHSINLQSCRALPRGIKRLYTGTAVIELRQSLQDKPKTEESGGSDNEQTSEQVAT